MKIPSVFIFCEIVRKEIPSIFIFRNGLEQITKFQVIFSSRKWFGSESRAFLYSEESLGTEFRAFFVPRNTQNSDGMNQNFRLFRVPRNNFLLGKRQPIETEEFLQVSKSLAP
jgi:hypothetical protein